MIKFSLFYLLAMVLTGVITFTMNLVLGSDRYRVISCSVFWPAFWYFYISEAIKEWNEDKSTN
jgi:hypothetical protein